VASASTALDGTALRRDNPPGYPISNSRSHRSDGFHGTQPKEARQSIPQRTSMAEPVAGRISAHTALGGTGPPRGLFPQMLDK
jgi:hypothetical protein